jgi:hypothetical protein
MDDLTIVAIRLRLQTKFTDLGGTSHSKLNPTNPVAIADDEKKTWFHVAAAHEAHLCRNRE